MYPHKKRPELTQFDKDIQVRLYVPLPEIGLGSGFIQYGTVREYISQIEWVMYQAKIKENFPEIDNPKYLETLREEDRKKHVVGYWYKLYFFKIIEGKVYCMRYRTGELAAYFTSPQFATDVPLINAEYVRIVSLTVGLERSHCAMPA